MLTYLLPFVGILSVGMTADAASQQGGAAVDFGPRKGWNTHGTIAVRSDGRISLTRDGRGILWKTVELDVDEFPVMLVRISDSITRERWLIAVEKIETPSFDENRWIRLVERSAEEGGFMVPLKKITGWSGKVRFVIMIIVEGRDRDWVEFDALEAVRLTNKNPVQPKLAIPENGTAISPLALHFVWFQATNAVEYELQVSASGDFSEHKSVRITPPYLADKLPYLPKDDELLAPGTWFWRVRASNLDGHSGSWSETSMFRIKETPSPPKLGIDSMPPELSVSTDHPLIILFGDNRLLAENWKAVPEELKPFTVFRIEELPSENFQPLLRIAQENHIPVIIQTSGPHDFYGRVSSRISLAEIEQFFLRFPVVKGVYICEQAFRISEDNNRIMMNYAERLIPLAASHGKMVIWADGHWGRNLWIDVGLNKRILDTIRTYRQYFIPLWKMNGAQTAYSAHDAVFGFWASKAVDNWGVQPERWYWFEAGFGKINEQFWFKEGKMEDFPSSFYGQMMLLGLSSGATVYSFEPAGDIWGEHGGLSETSQKETFPLLLEIIRHRWIPSREQILRKIPAVYVADSADSHWSMDYGTMRTLYEGAYGIRQPFQMIPSTSKYFWIPLVSKWTQASILQSFPDQISAETFSTTEAVTKHLNKHYVSRERGDAWVIELDGKMIIMNSHENRDIDQTFGVPMEGTIKKISGRLGVNGYMLAQKVSDGFWLHLNGRAGRNQLVELSILEKPHQIVVTPERALARSSWDATNRRLVLEFLLVKEAVSVGIRF